jgi:DNA recombination protein RmuC
MSAEGTMTETLLFAALVLLVGIAVTWFGRRTAGEPPSRVSELLQQIDNNVRSESAASRGELATELGRAREENRAVLAGLQSDLDERVRRLDETLTGALDRLRDSNDQRIELLRCDLLERQDRIREEADTNRRLLREEIATTLSGTTTTLLSSITEFSSVQRGQMETFGKQIGGLLEANDRRFDSLQHSVQQRLVEIENRTTEALAATRAAVEQKLDTSAREVLERHDRMSEEARVNRKQQRDEITSSLAQNAELMQKSIERIGAGQMAQMETFGAQITTLVTGNDSRFENLRTTMDARLSEIRDRNAEQLEQMRATVDEKLQGTLEKRLGESFKQVSDHLEQVHRGLGEMQLLAAGVGDLKRVLTNVKSRGGWGEVQLEALLEQMLAPAQFEKNVKVKDDTNQSVEFAICLPARGDTDEITYLPIDAKFPMEDYQRLCEAQERGDLAAVELASIALEQSVRKCAKDICENYINPPVTTDFAILYLPSEGLFAEVVRRRGLIERLQRDSRISVAGPTTLTAMLNSLQMGFRTLAIEKRSSQVWNILGAVKTEFGKFGTVLDGVKKKLDSASKTMDEAAVRSRAIERKLRDVEKIPEDKAEMGLLEVPPLPEDEPSN